MNILKCLFMLSLVALSACASRSATRIEGPSLNDYVTAVDVIATIQILKIKEISISDRKISECGYVVEAKVLENLKGIDDEHFRFFIRNVDDVLSGHSKYFVLAIGIEENSTSSYRQTLNSCGLVGPTYVVTVDQQMLFPFGDDGDRWIDSSVFLARRESFFSDRKYYAQSSFVTHFVTIDSRIYASINWEIVKSHLLDLLGR